MNKERLIFEVTDGVKTPEEVTLWEGGAHVSGDEVFFSNAILRHSISSLYWNLAQANPSWLLLGVRPGVGPEGFYLSICLLPRRIVWELSRSSGEIILAFIRCKTGGKPNR